MKKTRLLLISQVFYPDQVAVANLFTCLCAALVKEGVDIEVWCAQPTYTTSSRQPVSSVYKGILIRYVRSATFSKNRLPGRLVNYLTYSVSIIFKLLFSRSDSQVLAHTTPPFLAILISLICKVKKRRFLYVLMDVFPDGLIRLKKVSANNLFIKLWYKWHIKALGRCDRIIVIGRDMMEWICTISPEVAAKVRYIPLWQDEEAITPMEFSTNPFVLRNSLNGEFIVQYSGNMGLWNEIATIGKAINKCPPNVKFIIIGSGMRTDELTREINPGNKRVMLFPFQSNLDYSVSVTACHAALVSLRTGLEGMAVPSKIIGIIASGVPVIAMVPERSEIALIVNEENCGIVVPPSDPDALLSAIERLRSDEKLRQKLGNNGRDAFLKKYTTKIVAGSYLRLLTELPVNH